jgi:hypothetical protein
MGYFLLSKSATTTALDISEVLLLLFGLILTIGALGEYKKFPRLLKASHAMFELLVVIGIAGELVADGGVFVFSRHLQTISDGEFAALNKEAGDARKKAGEAIERAAAIEQDNLKLRAQIEPRRLTGTQKATLRGLLEGHPMPIAVAANLFDKESADFADDFVSALSEAHWTPVRRSWTRFKYGVSIGFVDVEAQNTPEVKLLAGALSAITVPCDFMRLVEVDTTMNPPPEPHVMYLLIGLHPTIRARFGQQVILACHAAPSVARQR